MKSLFCCSRLEGGERSLVTAMSGQAFLDHSDCFKPGRLVHEWPWLLKRSFIIPADSSAEFQWAIINKLVREVRSISGETRSEAADGGIRGRPTGLTP
ncbi:hypothetical protein SAMN05428953_115116 [Mesorhizobium muleiense]|uniref:Uncharacterized protein n=1 Tax=Mesorhizobium muleiense TaxID=1004279 RepID=A0A1G9C190_9HYPH|nr:hypothetical protein SAMN05428953_115116 [Mesorhizobium muleiense]